MMLDERVDRDLEPDVGLSIEIAADASALVVVVRGEHDLARCGDLDSTLRAALGHVDEVVVDLGNLTFCDSSGISLFVNAHEAAMRASKRLVLRNLLPHVSRVFEITGVDKIVDVAIARDEMPLARGTSSAPPLGSQNP
jgi:anti-sigma B factor antagonist